MAKLIPPRRDEDLLENGSKPTFRFAEWMEGVTNRAKETIGAAIGFDDAVVASRSDTRVSQLRATIVDLEKRIECLEQLSGR